MASEIINWEEALAYYLTKKEDGTYPSYKEVAEHFSVGETTVEEHGKSESWVKLRGDAEEIARQKLVKKAGTDIAQIKEKHLGIARTLQGKGLEVMGNKVKDENGVEHFVHGEKAMPQSFRDAREAIRDGIEIERKTLNLDKEEAGGGTTVQVILPDWYTKIPIDDEQPTNDTNQQ